MSNYSKCELDVIHTVYRVRQQYLKTQPESAVWQQRYQDNTPEQMADYQWDWSSLVRQALLYYRRGNFQRAENICQGGTG